MPRNQLHTTRSWWEARGQGKVVASSYYVYSSFLGVCYIFWMLESIFYGYSWQSSDMSPQGCVFSIVMMV
nr:hypothetical transcript [Hymenolepis microstoma]